MPNSRCSTRGKAHEVIETKPVSVPSSGPASPSLNVAAILTPTFTTRNATEYGAHAPIFPVPLSGHPHKLKIDQSQPFTHASIETASPAYTAGPSQCCMKCRL